MAMPVTLATTYGDPKGRLFELFERQRSKLFDTFAQVAVRADVAAYLPTLDRLGEMGARIDLSGDLQGPDSHGRKRREALALALETDGHFIFSCDMEQALRWLDGHPSELRRVLEMLSRHDATIVGRSERALLSYPRHIRDTEKVVNRVYALFTGRPYDLMAGARGFTRAAAHALVNGSDDDAISVDVSWPLYLEFERPMRLGYIVTDGLEFGDPRRRPSKTDTPIGEAVWTRRLDSDPSRWLHYGELMRRHLTAMRPYLTQVRAN